MVESLGVPHTEIDVILVNGASVDFSHRLYNCDDVAVYPVFESLDVTNVTRLRPAPLRTVTFICDVHLGRLARALRILGFYTLYRNDYTDHEIVAIASSDHRMVLTRDRGLLKHSAVTHGYCVRSTVWREQAREIIERFDLQKVSVPFSRCALCNGIIARVEKNEILGLLEDQTKKCYEAFSQCGSCRKIYWEGSHFVKLRELVKELIN
jgi:uncharacterized protein with PIN domain